MFSMSVNINPRMLLIRTQFLIQGVVSCFGGGALLSTVFIHLLGEVRESIEESSSAFGEIPLAELLVCCGEVENTS